MIDRKIELAFDKKKQTARAISTEIRKNLLFNSYYFLYIFDYSF